MAKSRIKNNIITIGFVIVVTLFISIPLFVHGIEGRYGQDLGFHLNRIEGIAVELEAGHFPVKMQSFWMDGYGYPVSVYYGDLLLYFPAMLRILGVGVVSAYKIFVLLINFATVAVTLLCFSRMFDKMKIAMLCTVIYGAASYRLENVYVRAAVGEYCAQIFFPVIIYAFYRIYKSPKGIGNKERFINALLLAVGVTGLINTHILSLEMTGLIALVTVLILFKKTFTKDVLLTYLYSLLSIITVNLFFIVPFVDYFFTQDVNINRTVNSTKLIQESGLKWREIFDFFKYPFANGDGADGRLLVTAGMACIIVIILAGIIIVMKKCTREIILFTVWSIVLLLIATCYFPWDELASSTRVGEFFAQIQFPWRYVGMVVALTSVLAGWVLERLSKLWIRRGVYILLCASCLVTVIWFSYEYAAYGDFKYYETRDELDTYDMGYIEYLRTDTSRESFTGRIEVEGTADVTLQDRNGADRDYYVSQPSNDDTFSISSSKITLPIANYKGYEIIDDKGNSIDITDGDNNLISFDIDNDYFGGLYLRFNQPVLWVIAEVISLIGVVILIVLYVLVNRRTEGAQ